MLIEVNEIASGRVSLLSGKRVDRAMSPFGRPAQSVDATQALNLSAGVSNCKVSRGRSLS
jgi:hypothetical protein